MKTNIKFGTSAMLAAMLLANMAFLSLLSKK